MFLGMYRFRGDPAELVAGHDRLVAALPPGQLVMHLCVQTDDGIAILDTCPDRRIFERFSTGHGFLDLLAQCGLPSPEVTLLGDVVSYLVPPS